VHSDSPVKHGDLQAYLSDLEITFWGCRKSSTTASSDNHIRLSIQYQHSSWRRILRYILWLQPKDIISFVQDRHTSVCALDNQHVVFCRSFNDHFPDGPGLASTRMSAFWILLELMVMGGGGDNRSYKTCKSSVKSSPPTNQHPVFYRPDALPVAQPTVSEHWRHNQHVVFC